jgi:hypothetical protein
VRRVSGARIVTRAMQRRVPLHRSWPAWLVVVLGGVGVASGVATAVASSHSAVVLGSKRLVSPDGDGFGTAHPADIYNGGDPSGHVTHIRWTDWGPTVATGVGLNAILQPQGGYYPGLVTIQLRAYDIGRCTAHGPLAYRKLSAREPSRPGGPLGPWSAWGGGHTTIC